MADKPPAKSPIAEVGMKDSDAVEQIIFLLAAMIILGALATAFLNHINNLSLGNYAATENRFTAYFFVHIWPVWKFVAVIVSVFSTIGIAYNLNKTQTIAIEENKIFNPFSAEATSEDLAVVESEEDRKWKNVLALANSDNDSNWRLAVIEADVMLEEALRSLGYVGDSVGDMLKGVEKGDFQTINDAWEAHKVRNDIAHSGSSFQLNQHETKRVIALFEKIFREFELI